MLPRVAGRRPISPKYRARASRTLRIAASPKAATWRSSSRPNSRAPLSTVSIALRTRSRKCGGVVASLRHAPAACASHKRGRIRRRRPLPAPSPAGIRRRPNVARNRRALGQRGAVGGQGPSRSPSRVLHSARRAFASQDARGEPRHCSSWAAARSSRRLPSAPWHAGCARPHRRDTHRAMPR